jgi:peptide/nickel transport system substrate-binding protein
VVAVQSHGKGLSVKGVIARGVVGVAALALVGVIGGCGGSGGSRSVTTAVRAATRIRPALDGAGEDLYDGVRGGTLTVLDHTDFPGFDPGEAYDAISYQVIYAVQRPLFSYLPNQTQMVSPDLASGPAIITDGGRTVTVQIRRDVHFSPPVNREVTSADVAYAIERGANPDVGNPYFPAYFDDIVGASKATGGPIAGIATPDRYTIVFHLTAPVGGFFAQALSLPLTAPVPREFAAPLDAKKPTQYGRRFEVATGPYMLKANARGMFLGIGYQPGRSVTLVRNPNWNPGTDHRPAYIDRIEISIGGDPNVIGRQVLRGSHMVQNDFVATPVIKLAYADHYDQLVAAQGTGVEYVTLNNGHGPFRNVDVRKAFWAALDRDEMLKANGGPVVAQLGTHFIYPGTEGYEQAGGAAGPRVDYNMYPGGNPALAARYMKAAGYTNGTYTGNAKVQIVAADGSPFTALATIVDQTLQDLGFHTNLTLLDPATVATKYCGVPAQEIDVCPNGGVIRDFADPQTVLAPNFAGYDITTTNNPNAGQVNDPEIDAAMKAAQNVVGASARAQAWARVDRMLVEIAAAVPWAFTSNPVIESRDVRGINDLWNLGSWDYSYTSLK